MRKTNFLKIQKKSHFSIYVSLKVIKMHSMSVYETYSVLYFLTFGCDIKSQA
jgi:hypothetical protein